jgi:SAM-dependent methyltransferase
MQEQETYFNLLAELDLTTHLGGLAATRRLAERAGIRAGTRVLDVGCGVGVTPLFLAQEYGCRVVGVDLYERMIERARARARRAGVGDRIAFRVADVHELPFEAGEFDVTLTESVIALVRDQRRALAECARVLRPGGSVGLVEATWVKPATPRLLSYIARAYGEQTEVHTREGWMALLEGVGLQQVGGEVHRITVGREFANRVRRLGFRHMLRSWAKSLYLFLARPQYRQFLNEATTESRRLFKRWGYGIYTGKQGV